MAFEFSFELAFELTGFWRTGYQLFKSWVKKKNLSAYLSLELEINSVGVSTAKLRTQSVWPAKVFIHDPAFHIFTVLSADAKTRTKTLYINQKIGNKIGKYLNWKSRYLTRTCAEWMKPRAPRTFLTKKIGAPCVHMRK